MKKRILAYWLTQLIAIKSQCFFIALFGESDMSLFKALADPDAICTTP